MMPPTRLFMVLYTSVAVRHMTENDLMRILEVSKRNNDRDELTGLLVYHRGSFMQVLEGPSDALDRTFGRIAADTRHRAVTTLLRQPIRERAFGPWKMSFVNLANPEGADVPGFSRYMLDMLETVEDYQGNSVAMSFIETFRQLTAGRVLKRGNANRPLT